MIEAITYRAGRGKASGSEDVDPITTEVIRQGLNSAAEQMKVALIRTAFSPIIYEALDFAVALYDEQIRLLAQAPSLPLFMGTMSFCVEAAVQAAGGQNSLRPGDILLYNFPYGTGSHPQDVAVVMPVFHLERELVGYATIKGHLLDVGGKEPYSTDTLDVFQEGTVFPGVRLYRRGELVEDIYRLALANSRMPKFIGGDLNAEVVGVRTGAAALVRLIDRHGLDTYRNSVERMFDHGELIVRSYFKNIPPGRYVGRGEMDSNGLNDIPIPFEIAIEVEGSSVRVDYSAVPDAQPGPVNCPLASTVSASRVAISMLSGGAEAPNEGHFRPIEVTTRPGSMFHPLSPAPTQLYAWPAMQAIEVIYRALAEAMPEGVPASSGGDLCGIAWWGVREATGEPWLDGPPHPVGQGAHRFGDGASSLMHIGLGCCRFHPTEVWESKYPSVIERIELAQDSGGPGKYRGGLGVDFIYRTTEPCWITSTVERTKSSPWGLAGGGEGRPNHAALTYPDGTTVPFGKVTRLHLPKGTQVALQTGGGGGFGPASARDPLAVLDDIRQGYISADHARVHYNTASGERA